MVKAHSPINWENEPSKNTPINEENLNKMDKTIGVLDDRIIAQDTSKLDKSTAYTMVKDISFNENNGVFTITRLNGSTFTIDTRLEKIAINFKYDYSTQKLIVTLIDGTTQSIDMSALLTQYEFTDSATLDFSTDSSGKVTATIKSGSITEDMLQPNYLAEIKVETAKSAQSMTNAKISENNAKQSELNAKESEEKALEYSNNAQPLAQSVSGTNPTITNSTDGNVTYLKNSGYTEQDGTPTPDTPIEIKGLGDSGTIEVKTYGKNLLQNTAESTTINGVTFTVNDDGSVTASGTATSQTILRINSKFMINGSASTPGKQYIISGVDKNASTSTYCIFMRYYNSGGTHSIDEYCTATTGKKIRTNMLYMFIGLLIKSGVTVNTTFYPQLELGDTATDYEPYTETTASIPISAPLYDGDYIEVYADGSGKIVRNMASIVYDGSQSGWSQYNNEFIHTISDAKAPIDNYTLANLYCSHFTNTSRLSMGDGLCSMSSSKIFLIQDTDEFNTVDELNAWLQSNPMTVLYEKAEPTTEPLTTEQIQAFKQLQTFKSVTHVNADGEVTVRYYCNNDSGDSVAKLQEQVKGISSDVIEELQEDIQAISDDIAEQIEIVSNANIYSTTEVECGTWLGDTLYQKTFTIWVSDGILAEETPHSLGDDIAQIWIDDSMSFYEFIDGSTTSISGSTATCTVDKTNIMFSDIGNTSMLSTAYITLKYIKLS